MSDFPHKSFEGQVYTFAHLGQRVLPVDLVVEKQPISVPVRVTFGCHCFTEDFDTAKHGDHHRYAHLGEVRAFDLERYACSLQLPRVVDAILGGTIYRSDQNYTYVSQVVIPPVSGQQPYSIFFSLEKTKKAAAPAVEMYVKSAYLSPLKHKPNAQNWRFKALVGETAGLFDPKAKARKK